jgi:N-acetylneuraminate synthase/N,N'-diacetyllegionaminate synthase
MSRYPAFEITGRKIGPNQPPYLIAEVGINHGGNPDLARRMVIEAAESGADAVKLQTFRSELFLTRSNQFFDVLKAAELSEQAIRDLMALARSKGIALFSSVFDTPSAKLMAELATPAFKIASGDVTNIPLLRDVALLRQPIVLSSGGATMGEVETALATIREKDAAAQVSVLHCVSNYPTRPEDANLACLKTMAAQLGVPVGFSDHTHGEATAIAAVASGACIIEKHFTYDRNAEGPDHALSCDPAGLKRLAEGMLVAWQSLGRSAKAPVEPADFIPLIRRSLTASRPIAAGQVLAEGDLVIKRPGTGIQPEHFDAVIGMRASVAIAEDETITWDKLSRT